MRIEDGGGNNGFAKVDSNQKLEVASEAASILYHKSKLNASVYVQYSKRNFAAATTDENIFHMTYTGEGTLVIAKAVCATNSTSGKVEFFKNPTYTSGGDSREAINFNFGSSLPANTTTYSSDTSEVVMTTVSANELMDVRISINGDSTESVDFEGALRLKKGDSFGAKGEVATIAERIRISLFFFEE